MTQIELLDELLVTVSGGDILKGYEISWRFTLQEVRPYIKYNLKKNLISEAICQFAGIDLDDKKSKNKEIEYKKIIDKKKRGEILTEKDRDFLRNY